MDRRFLRIHELDPLSEVHELNIEIDGSALTTSLATAGVVIGKTFITAKDDGSNTVTIAFKRPLKRAPHVHASTYTADCVVRVTSRTTTGIEYITVQNDDTTTGVDDADVFLTLKCFESVDLG